MAAAPVYHVTLELDMRCALRFVALLMISGCLVPVRRGPAADTGTGVQDTGDAGNNMADVSADPTSDGPAEVSTDAPAEGPTDGSGVGDAGLTLIANDALTLNARDRTFVLSGLDLMLWNEGTARMEAGPLRVEFDGGEGFEDLLPEGTVFGPLPAGTRSGFGGAGIPFAAFDNPRGTLRVTYTPAGSAPISRAASLTRPPIPELRVTRVWLEVTEESEPVLPVLVFEVANIGDGAFPDAAAPAIVADLSFALLAGTEPWPESIADLYGARLALDAPIEVGATLELELVLTRWITLGDLVVETAIPDGVWIVGRDIGDRHAVFAPEVPLPDLTFVSGAARQVDDTWVAELTVENAGAEGTGGVVVAELVVPAVGGAPGCLSFHEEAPAMAAGARETLTFDAVVAPACVPDLSSAYASVVARSDDDAGAAWPDADPSNNSGELTGAP